MGKHKQSLHDELSERRRERGQEGYHKGDQHSGGGGSHGGGGKRHRPPEGWEKGDAVRDVDTEHTLHDVPIKPGRDPDRKADEKAHHREVVNVLHHRED
jgi:hypothetical protein